MKHLMLMALATSGILLMNSNEANAQSWRSGRGSGFGISLNFSSPQNFNSRSRYQNAGFGYDSGLQRNDRYRNTGYGFNSGFAAPSHGYRRTVPNQFRGYSNRYLPVHRYSPQRSYRGGCRY